MQNNSNLENQFNSLLDEYGRFLRQTIMRICPNDLGILYDEIEQDVRLRLWRVLASERVIKEPTSYLYRIAATATLDAIRRVKRKREEQMNTESVHEGELFTPQNFIANPKLAPDRAAERQELVTKIKLAISQLADNRRQAVTLHLEGLSTQEIAGVLGWTEPKARNLVYRGLQDLRALLQEAGIQYEAQ